VELCRQVLPGMLARGRGHLVNMSSLSGVATFPGLAAYGSSKAGLTSFTAGLRADLRGTPIGTTLVEVGPVRTALLDGIVSYAPASDSFARMYRLRLLRDCSATEVARATVAAVQAGRRHVRLPRRTAAVAMVAEAPRRATEIVLGRVAARAGR
jgi:short-subunit dehydrogenase